MKTIYVDSKEMNLGDKSLGTVTNVQMNASVNMYSEKVNVWVAISSNNQTLANKNIEIACESTGVVWSDIEAAILSEIGLVKSENQNPSPASL